MVVVQVMTFTVNEEAAQLDSAHVPSRIELAMDDFAGLLSDRWEMHPNGQLVGINSWEDGRSLEVFRHSELYARLMLCPQLETPRDYSFAPESESFAPDASAFLAAA